MGIFRQHFTQYFVSILRDQSPGKTGAVENVGLGEYSLPLEETNLTQLGQCAERVV